MEAEFYIHLSRSLTSGHILCGLEKPFMSMTLKQAHITVIAPSGRAPGRLRQYMWRTASTVRSEVTN